MGMSEEKINVATYRKELEKMAAKIAMISDPKEKEEETKRACRLYNTAEAMGRAAYKSYTDEELLDILRERTKELGYVPAQKEVFEVYRNYIRLRFGKWPYALRKADLSTRAGRGGMTLIKMEQRAQRYEELMGLVRQKAKELGRSPHMFEMKEIQRELRGWFTTWAEVLDAAGIGRDWQRKEILYKIKNLTEEEQELLQQLSLQAKRLGRAPLRSEVADEIRRKLNKRCGTWRNTLYQLGMEPVTKVSPFSNTFLNQGRVCHKKHKDILADSLYKLVDPDEKTQAMLQEVKNIAQKLGRPPVKSEIASEVYTHLSRKCTTYRNILYQI